MTTSGRARGKWIAGAALVTLCAGLFAVAGCGPDGVATVIVPPPATPRPTPSPTPPVPLVSGTVLAPNGQYAAAKPRQRWLDGLVITTAYASIENPSVSAVGGDVPVQLWQ